MFHLLGTINFNQSWDQIAHDLGYDLGDYLFEDKETYDRVRKTAKLLWAELNGYFDDGGNTPSVHVIKENRKVRKTTTASKTPRRGYIDSKSDIGFNHWNVKFEDSNEPVAPKKKQIGNYRRVISQQPKLDSFIVIDENENNIEFEGEKFLTSDQVYRLFLREQKKEFAEKVIRDFRTECLPFGEHPDYVIIEFIKKYFEDEK